MATYSGQSLLESLIRERLPELGEEITAKLIIHLESLGVSDSDDLKLVEPEELIPPLKIIQARKFLQTKSGSVDDQQKYELKLKEIEIQMKDQEIKLREQELKKVDQELRKTDQELEKGTQDIKKRDQELEKGNQALKKGEQELEKGNQELKKGEQKLKKENLEVLKGEQDLKKLRITVEHAKDLSDCIDKVGNKIKSLSSKGETKKITTTAAVVGGLTLAGAGLGAVIGVVAGPVGAVVGAKVGACAAGGAVAGLGAGITASVFIKDSTPTQNALTATDKTEIKELQQYRREMRKQLMNNKILSVDQDAKKENPKSWGMSRDKSNNTHREGFSCNTDDTRENNSMSQEETIKKRKVLFEDGLRLKDEIRQLRERIMEREMADRQKEEST